ncbi:MAG: hypothetical protein Q7V58_07670 [Actinomycetota bacterium]|nr:hypothetical protein [Actinomycetota bacterium]
MAAKDNKLEVGQSRIGLMIDGLPDTPRVAVKLERTDKRVEVTIPLLDGHGDVYQYWFSSGIIYGDDPDKTKRRYEPPESISFYDARGPVGLVGSSASGSTMNFGGAGIGEGRLTFDYAILGAGSGADYESINGLRSEVEGLGTWVGLRSLNAEREIKDGRLASVNLRLESSPSIRAGRLLNAEFQSNWRYGPGPGPDQTTIAERMQIHTQIKKAVSWEDHFKVHFPLRNLLRVASWQRLNFVGHEVVSVADPLRTLDGKAHGDQWLPVITYRTGITESASKLSWMDFLFSYADVESKGVGRWIDLSNRFERGLTPLVGLLDLGGASLEAHLAQVGIGFEMLGYDLMLETGAIARGQAYVKFADQVAAVLDTVANLLPFPTTDFQELLRRTYMGVKHADNAQPNRQEMHLAYRQAIQVFRAWVALRLGMPKAKLKAALENDKVTRQIREIERSLATP